MEGGIAILLLLIIAVVVGGIALFGFFGGGALGLSKEKDDEGGRFSRPKHKRVTNETLENTEMVGTRGADDERR